MQKVKYFTCFYHTVLIFVSKRCRKYDSTHLILKINNKRELENIAINHSGDIDYQDFMKIYKECTKEFFNFLTIDTMLPASSPLRFRKKLFDSYKNDNN